MTGLLQCVNISDLRDLARRRLHPLLFDYIDGGADDEQAMRRNQTAFDRFDIAYRVLRGSTEFDLSTVLLGRRIAVPFITAPTAANRLFHNEGETAVARAAATLGTVYTLSALSTVSIEDIGRLSTTPKWFQIYPWKDRGLISEMLQRIRQQNFDALVLTVDLATQGNRERDRRNKLTVPPKVSLRNVLGAVRRPRWLAGYVLSKPVRFANIAEQLPAYDQARFAADRMDGCFNWNDAEWLLGEWNGKAVIKGIVRSDDAQRAVELGFDAVVVSNHGGRQLDASPAALDALDSVVQQVGSDCDVVLDGGIRRGTDMIKALAIGAKAVSFARPYLYGLASGGECGVSFALRILERELINAMKLCGVNNLAEISPDLLRRRQTPLQIW